MEILAPHFPKIRYIKRLFYSLVNFNKELCDMDEALNSNDVIKLCHISDQAQKKAQICNKSNTEEITLNEDKIQTVYSHAFRAYTKRMIDTPRFKCISCEKLCCQKSGSFIEISKTMLGPIWTSFMEYLAKCLPKPNEYNFLCRYCRDKFHQDTLPPICILNSLDVPAVPYEITCLNSFERILIQRVKAFQTVQKLQPVSKTNMPHRHRVPKVVGRTFHLPLPLEETIKKVCPRTEAINPNHELYILVRGIPTKSKIVWERLVDLKKVWKALKWLKSNNPHYYEVKLPLSHEGLLPDELPEVEFQDLTQLQSDSVVQSTSHCTIPDKEDNKSILDINEQKKAALLTQMSQSDLYYEQFTIYPIHEKRVNATATELYQMLKVNDVPLDRRFKALDTMCFPDLYPHGTTGSMLKEHNIRQINAGIFHKMNVTNPREKYTAASYLERLSKNELESNLSTIFARLRNSEEYWRIPRNNVRCMTRHYGPATWFLTISPISVSRFVEIKLKAVLDFILSPNNPIGEVDHYFYRREYQSRGAQHFHILIWIKDAPIIGKSTTEEIASFILNGTVIMVIVYDLRKPKPVLHDCASSAIRDHSQSQLKLEMWLCQLQEEDD
ncbi:uncharacterized protein LOC112494451 [Cephus cinctus]|uniref:Uncharacterized protein LOC112494451 n=1 Tax=Cephus cinctus TaxID=211228 RepID=A0AAJ7W1T8_CEPCN|nr:uncharacterized protein LOC112494451 [Cephus cinctus]